MHAKNSGMMWYEEEGSRKEWKMTTKARPYHGKERVVQHQPKSPFPRLIPSPTPLSHTRLAHIYRTLRILQILSPLFVHPLNTYKYSSPAPLITLIANTGLHNVNHRGELQRESENWSAGQRGDA